MDNLINQSIDPSIDPLNHMERQQELLAEERTTAASEQTKLALERTILAHERSVLANERTMLALLRTGLSFIGLGIALLNLYKQYQWILYIGYASVIVGICFIIYGIFSA